MELRILGCDGSYPAALGACSGYLVDAGAEGRILLDCGSGVMGKLMSVTDPASLDAIVLTHWHNDHASDMLVLRYYLQIAGVKLPLYAPPEGGALRTLCECPQFDLCDLAGGLKLKGLTVQAHPVVHAVPAYALKIIHGSNTLVYTGDISKTDGAAAFIGPADVLLCDATFTNAQWHAGMPHLSARQAAELALEAGVGRLVLTHCPPSNDPHTLLREAREVFADSLSAYPGLIVPL